MKDFELIQKYLRKQLSDDEKIEFEKRQKQDSDFEQKINRQLELDIMMAFELSDEKLEPMVTSETGQNQKKWRISWKYWVAAALLILAFLIGLIWKSTQPTRHEIIIAHLEPALYSEESKLEELIIHQEKKPSFYGDVAISAKNFRHRYRQKQWGIAQITLSDSILVPKNMPEMKHEIQFYLAEIAIQKKEYSRAKEILKTLENQPKDLWYSETVYYQLGLIYLAENQTQKGIEYLKKIHHSEQYGSEIQTILALF